LLLDRDAPAVVGHLDRTVAVEGHVDAVGVPGGGLVDGVVDEFPQQVGETVGTGATDVQAGRLTRAVEALKDLDVRGVGAGGGGLGGTGHQNLLVPTPSMRSSVVLLWVSRRLGVRVSAAGVGSGLVGASAWPTTSASSSTGPT